MLIASFANLNGFSNLRHAVFTRRGGVSAKPFDSLNLSSATGDDPADVAANIDILRHYLRTPFVAELKQCHSAKIVMVDKANRHLLNAPHAAQEGDALVTVLPNTALLVKVADCQPVLLADPVKGVVAAVHSGWRGSVQNITGKTVTFMQTQFGCNPQNIMGGIGPSLGPCCAEFINYETELPPEFWPFKTQGSRFDFWRISALQMQQAGIPAANIEVSGLCTVCNPNLFFSYRRQQRTGRFGAAIMLTES